MSSRNEQRLQSYKNSNKKEAQKKKRFENTIQLRKEKRSDQLQKRRNICESGDENTNNPLKECSNQAQLGTVDEIISRLLDDTDKNMQLDATREARKVLSREKNPPIQLFIKAGTVNKLVQFLSWSDNQEMLFEATWTLTNIASGNQSETLAVVNAEAVPPLINLLVCPYFNVAEQSMWALGNIAGDSSDMRDLVLNHGILKNLLALANAVIPNSNSPELFTPEVVSGIQNLAWTLSNLCRNRYPPTEIHFVQKIIPILCRLLTVEDVKTKTDAMWAFSYITDGPNDRIQLMLDNDIHRQIVYVLSTVYIPETNIPAIRSLGNIITGSDLQTQAVIDAGLLQALTNLSQSPTMASIQKEMAWVISNILAGTNEQIQQVIDSNLIGWVVLLCAQADYKTRKEAAWAITNLASSGNLSQKKRLVDEYGVESLCSMLSVNDNKMIEVCLGGLTNLAAVSELQEIVVLKIEESQGLDKIEELQNHEQETIYKLAFNLIDKYFSNEEDGGVTSSENAFTFTQVESAEQFNF